ncbi:hypothetical protein GCM10020229_41820 [Kitasatospora albolonga]
MWTRDPLVEALIRCYVLLAEHRLAAHVQLPPHLAAPKISISRGNPMDSITSTRLRRLAVLAAAVALAVTGCSSAGSGSGGDVYHT